MEETRSIAKRILDERGYLSEEESIRREAELKREWKKNFKPFFLNTFSAMKLLGRE